METEKNYVGDVVAFEEDDHYSREAVTILSGEGVLAMGTVLAKVTASGKYVVSTDDASDGSQTSIAVLIQPVDATSADVVATAIVRHAAVKRAGLVFGPDIDDATKLAAAEAELKAVGILIRESV